MHWPELHALFTSGSNYTNENKRYNVINNPHITFNNKIDDDYKTCTRCFNALKRHFQEL